MIKNIFLVVLGTFILAFGTAIFLVPSDLVTGGMSGIAIVANAIYEIPTGSLPFNSIDIYVFILEWVLFFLGLISKIATYYIILAPKIGQKDVNVYDDYFYPTKGFTNKKYKLIFVHNLLNYEVLY